MTFVTHGQAIPGSDLLSRLASHKRLGSVPRHELEWLVAHGELRRFGVGEVVVSPQTPVVEMVIVLAGTLAIYVDRGAGRRKVLEWRAGDVSGLLPYSRMVSSPGDGVIEEAADIILIHRDHFPEMIRECPQVTAALVHAMLDRARLFTSTEGQDEKMMSLGRLAAGLAHELNNPASAAARSAEVLARALADADEASHLLGAAHLTDEQRTAVDRLRAHCQAAPVTGVASPLQRADREDEVTDWLERHGAGTTPAPALAESGLSIAALDDLARTIPAGALDAAVQWIASGCLTHSLAGEITRATRRIHELVSAVKRFTYMDRATVTAPVNIATGVNDTVAVLAAKARAKSITVTVNVAPELPPVRAYGGELNQIWSNLLDNALDAVPASGHVVVSAQPEGDQVVVRVVDDGPGIPSEIQARIFDPFFTTKPVGEGTGLGLDITRRIVRVHSGRIDVDSKPGRTEFRVTLPAEPHASLPPAQP